MTMVVLSKGGLASGHTPMTISSFDEVTSFVTKLVPSTNSESGSSLWTLYNISGLSHI